MKLKVKIKSDTAQAGADIYNNLVDAKNFKLVGQILMDLDNFGVPVDKSVKEYNKLKKSDWEAAIGA